MEEVSVEVEEISNAGTDSNLNKLKNPLIERLGDFFVEAFYFSKILLYLLRILKLFTTTLTELPAMAAAAMIGLRKPKAARGIAMML